jgi:hypothetical protein
MKREFLRKIILFTGGILHTSTGQNGKHTFIFECLAPGKNMKKESHLIRKAPSSEIFKRTRGISFFENLPRR